MNAQDITDLLGEDFSTNSLGEDMTGADLTAGWLPDKSIVHVPLTVIGDPVAGPPSDQPLQINRDDRPIATDELGMEGPFVIQWKKESHRAAGRTFPLNYDYGAGLDPENPGLAPEQDTLRPSVIGPGNTPEAHDGVPPIELVGSPRTVLYTANPAVGWDGY